MAPQTTLLIRCFLLATMIVTSVMAQNACDNQPITAILPDPQKCQLYYNCSNNLEAGYGFEKNMEECTYPQNFDPVSKQCKNYDQVDCQDREEELEACNYLANMNNGPHSIPCHMLYPSCVGLSDGPNPHNSKLWTPVYIWCRDQRTVDSDLRCPVDDHLNLIMIFSPDLNRCASWDELPEEHREIYFNCAQEADGRYPHHSRQDIYFVCENGQLTKIGKMS